MFSMKRSFFIAQLHQIAHHPQAVRSLFNQVAYNDENILPAVPCLFQKPYQTVQLPVYVAYNNKPLPGRRP